MFILSKILTFLILPPGIILAALIAGLSLLAARKRKAAFVTLAAATAVLLLLSFGPFSDLLIRPLEDECTALPPVVRLNPKDFSSYGAIAVLGGGSTENSPEEGSRTSLVKSGLKRAVYGALLAKRLGLPLIYSSGIVYARDGVETEAEAARRFWISLGIDPAMILIEDKSRNTYENAAFVAEMAGGRDLVLVTSAYHMKRSAFSFRRQGLGFLPAPTDYRGQRSPYVWADFFPSIGALDKSWDALHEYIGLAYYSLLK
jgi:uncharacterized SAM-binding protein YcdF (DUF218 family)